MKIQTLVALRIKEVRKNKGITQEGVAFAAGIDRTFMNHVENGRKNVSVITLEKIVVEGLKITMHDFFNAEMFVTGKYFNK